MQKKNSNGMSLSRHLFVKVTLVGLAKLCGSCEATGESVSQHHCGSVDKIE